MKLSLLTPPSPAPRQLLHCCHACLGPATVALSILGQRRLNENATRDSCSNWQLGKMPRTVPSPGPAPSTPRALCPVCLPRRIINRVCARRAKLLIATTGNCRHVCCHSQEQQQQQQQEEEGQQGKPDAVVALHFALKSATVLATQSVCSCHLMS